MDRGAWGLEVLILLAAWKTACPEHVTLLRGNHESTTCTRLYGFHAEVQAKYGHHGAQSIYAAAKRAFAALPLAAHIAGTLHALILLCSWALFQGEHAGSLLGHRGAVWSSFQSTLHQAWHRSRSAQGRSVPSQPRGDATQPIRSARAAAGNTLVVHGGLFRKPPPPATGGARGRKRRRLARDSGPLQLGNLSDLAAASAPWLHVSLLTCMQHALLASSVDVSERPASSSWVCKHLEGTSVPCCLQAVGFDAAKSAAGRQLSCAVWHAVQARAATTLTGWEHPSSQQTSCGQTQALTQA